MSERKEICENCRYWDSEQGTHKGLGECRKSFPMIVERLMKEGDIDSVYYATCWPETYDNGWCGKWRGVKGG